MYEVRLPVTIVLEQPCRGRNYAVVVATFALVSWVFVGDDVGTIAVGTGCLAAAEAYCVPAPLVGN